MSLTNWNASSPPPVRQPADPAIPATSHDATADPILASPEAQFLADLLRSIQSNRDAQEGERKRRLEWEAGVEARYKARGAEMDIRCTSMQQQIDALRTALGHGPVVALPEAAAVMPVDPVLPLSAAVPIAAAATQIPVRSQRPVPIQPRGNQPLVASDAPPQQTASVLGKRTRGAAAAAAVPSAPVQVDHPSLISPVDPVTAALTESDMENLLATKKKKDSRPTTVQTATRTHLLRVMALSSDKLLPPSHPEDSALPPGAPMRFVWDKTPKQSPHNARMKAAFIASLQAARALYPFVPEADFAHAALDRAFDQAFVTLRQKARSQAGLAPQTEEQRLEQKSKRARRANRKKAKLAHRLAARARVPALQDPVFDAALEIQMMSSESSDSEQEHEGGGEGDGEGEAEAEGSEAPGARAGREKSFRVRGLPWRSQRLKSLYVALDTADEKEQRSKPRRGAGRKERRVGRDKAGEEGLPPRGLQGWMISKRFGAGLGTEGDALRAVGGVGEPAVDWRGYGLGEESDVEDNAE